jgi:hypothetical protein
MDDINNEMKKEDQETEIYNNKNTNLDDINKEREIINVNENSQNEELKSNNEKNNINNNIILGNKKEIKENLNRKNDCIYINNRNNNKNNQNKIILNKHKNELINKEYNDLNNQANNNIKINNYIPVPNPQSFHFFNPLSKPSPIKPPQNMNKNKNISIKTKSNNKNIFQRLFKEAQYQRIFPKKPCHFRYKKSNHNRELLTLIENEINKKERKLNLKIGNKTSNNYGEYLYERDRKYQEEKEKKMVLMKQMKYQEEKKYFTFKPNINTNKNDIKYNLNKKERSYEKNRINNNINKYLFVNNNFKTENNKVKENNNSHNLSNNYKFKDNQNYIKQNKILTYTNSNNKKQNRNKINIPYDKNRSNINNNNNQKVTDSRVKAPINKINLVSSKSFTYKSFNNNTNSNIISEEENRNIFINLFNSINNGQKNFISANALNFNKISKNILNIINPIIQELLSNKNKKMDKEEFISCMNELFNNISSYDKRLIIYTYNTKYNQNKSLVLNNHKNNFTQLHKRAETPDFSLKNKYNFYYNDNNNKPVNNLKNNIGFQSSKAQKKLEQFLYGSNTKFYNGF